MNYMERYLAATSGKSKKKEDSEDHSAADSQEAVLDHGDTKCLSRGLNRIDLNNRNRGKIDVLDQITSHAVIHDRPSFSSGMGPSMSSFGTVGPSMTSFGSLGKSTASFTVYDEITVLEEEVEEEEEEEEEEIIEEVMEEVVKEDEDYAWGGSISGSERTRLSQRFPAQSFRKSTADASVGSSAYEEQTVITTSQTSAYDEVTVTEEVTVVEGDLDDYNEDEASASHNSDLDSDDGMPEDDDDEQDEENQGEGFTLAFKRNSANQARVSDITLDHSSWANEMDGEFDEDELYVPGKGEEGYCVQFKEGNFRSSIVSKPTQNSKTATKKFGPSFTNKFLPSNKFSVPKMPATSSFIPKKMPTVAAPRLNAPAPRVSIMKQFANKPLPALTEVSARKERGEKKKKKKPEKSFDGAGEKKELFLFWERKSTT